MTEPEAKGLAVMGAARYADRVAQGRDWRSRLPPDTRQLLEGIVLASAWVPIEHLAGILRVVAALEGRTFAQVVETQSRMAAKADVEGKYRHALRATTPAEMAPRLPRAFARYFRPCRATILRLVEPAFEVAVEPVPHAHEELMRATNQGFVTGALEAAGARRVDFEWEAPAAVDGALRLVFRASWR